MAAIQPPQHTLIAAIDAALEAKQESPRGHLGASLIGHPCDRYIWLSFRWINQPKHPGRILRVFRRGHYEESWVHADLRAAGLEVWDVDPATGSQIRFDDGHFQGSIDGVVQGLPEAPQTPHLLEIKTHSAKSFGELVKHGVKASKPQHFAQMQVYMLMMDLTRALYYAVNKDNDEIYTERIEFDAEIANRLRDRAHRLINEPYIPAPLSTDPTWWECKYCSAYSLCHEKKGSADKHCRSCAHSTPVDGGEWLCEEAHPATKPITFHAQRMGCDGHSLHPDLEAGKC
jgi:CRISPR/Cas system-associated exonuclease Cas4 (RecB family)